MLHRNLKHWLHKMPHPAAVLADGQRIEMPKSPRGVVTLIETIRALDPSKLACIDEEGNVLRAVVMDVEDGTSEQRERPRVAAEANAPEQSDLQLFARLLAEGYEHGRKANQPIIDSAMQFVERQGQRLAKTESEIERLRLHIHKLNLQIAELSMVPVEAPSEDSESIMGALVAGALQGAAAQQKPNVTPLAGVKK